MPVAASRKQYRMMMAILHGKVKDGPRGRPPKSVAAKYTDPGKDAPESKDNDRGGTWGAGGKKHKKEKSKKKTKKELKKSFEEFYKGRGRFAATIVMDANNRVLLGKHKSGGWAVAGGSVEPNETFEAAALRELNEESGAVGRLSGKVWEGTTEGNDGVVFLAEIASGKPKNTDEVKGWKWFEIDQIPWNDMRECCVPSLKDFIYSHFGKSIRGMLSLEVLEKAHKPLPNDSIAVNDKDTLKLVGVGLFRHLKPQLEKLSEESLAEINFDTYKLCVRKHIDDTYSGRVEDGLKTVYQFTHKSIVELTAALMSLFEWFLPEDENLIELLSDENIPDDAVHGGLHHLVDNYRRHNLGEIYKEVETIRSQIRQSHAVDLQQVEAKILKLFDKLESTVQSAAVKHNELAQAVGKDLDELENKLRQLQAVVESSPKKTSGEALVEGFSSNPANSGKVHGSLYSYLSKPRVEVHPNGKIVIAFSDDWQDFERSNFLEDLRVKVKNGK